MTLSLSSCIAAARHQHAQPERVRESGEERDVPGEVGRRPQRHPNPLAALHQEEEGEREGGGRDGGGEEAGPGRQQLLVQVCTSVVVFCWGSIQ